MGDGLGESALLLGEVAEQGLDLTALGCQFPGPLQIPGRLLLVVLAQLKEAQVRPGRGFFRDQLSCLTQFLPGQVLALRFNGRHPDLKGPQILLIQRRARLR
jgi:hypothetical protein